MPARMKSMSEQKMREALASIDSMIVSGALHGNGTDLTAHRNGLVLARNVIAAAPSLDVPEEWPIRGVRVDGDMVIISVKGGNDAARWLCGALLASKVGA